MNHATLKKTYSKPNNNSKVKEKRILGKKMYSKIFDKKKGFGYFYIENNESQIWLEANLDFSDSRGMRLEGTDQKVIQKIIQPKSNWIQVFTAKKIPYSVSLQITYKAHLFPPKISKKPVKKKKKIKPKRILKFENELGPLSNESTRNIILKKENCGSESRIEFENISDLVYEIQLLFELRNVEFSEKYDPVFVLFPGQKKVMVAKCANNKKQGVLRLLHDKREILGR